MRRHTRNTTLLYLLAEFNAVNLIKIHPAIVSCLEIEKGQRYGCALFAANATGSHEALETFMEYLETTQTMKSFLERRYKVLPVEKHKMKSLGRHFKYSKRVERIRLAMQSGSLALLVHLLESEKSDMKTRDMKIKAYVHDAIMERRSDAIEVLLDEGVGINVQDGDFGSALCIASCRGYLAIVGLLLDRGVDVNAQDSFYSSALQAALSQGYLAIVRLLRDRGADLSALGGYYGSALETAVNQDHPDITTLFRHELALSSSDEST